MVSSEQHQELELGIITSSQKRRRKILIDNARKISDNYEKTVPEVKDLLKDIYEFYSDLFIKEDDKIEISIGWNKTATIKKYSETNLAIARYGTGISFTFQNDGSSYNKLEEKETKVIIAVHKKTFQDTEKVLDEIEEYQNITNNNIARQLAEVNIYKNKS